MSQMSQKMLSTDLQTSDGAWSLVSVLPLARGGRMQGQAGSGPFLFILQDHHWVGESVPGLWKGLIHPQERFGAVLRREIFGRRW